MVNIVLQFVPITVKLVDTQMDFVLAKRGGWVTIALKVLTIIILLYNWEEHHYN